jgi:hypothetical protein
MLTPFCASPRMAQDFIVREVSLAKEVVQLKNTSSSIALPSDEAGSAAGAASAPAAEPAVDGGGPDAGAAGATAADAQVADAPAGMQELEALIGKDLAERVLALKVKGKGADANDGDPKKWEVCSDVCLTDVARCSAAAPSP